MQETLQTQTEATPEEPQYLRVSSFCKKNGLKPRAVYYAISRGVFDAYKLADPDGRGILIREDAPSKTRAPRLKLSDRQKRVLSDDSLTEYLPSGKQKPWRAFLSASGLTLYPDGDGISGLGVTKYQALRKLVKKLGK